jgi:hypothetical protein
MRHGKTDAPEDHVHNLSRHRGLRFIGWVAAYVLALQTMLLGFGAAPSLTAASTGSLAVELCLTKDTVPGMPAEHRAAEHCPGCLAAAGALSPQPADANAIRYAASLASPKAAARTPVAIAPEGRPNLPRAPPHLA